MTREYIPAARVYDLDDNRERVGVRELSSLEAEIPALRRYGLALVRNPAKADDLVQDTLVRAIDRISEDDLHGFVDGRLDAERRAAVDAFLREAPEAAARVAGGPAGRRRCWPCGMSPRHDQFHPASMFIVSRHSAVRGIGLPRGWPPGWS